jgi:hypothetical protein
MKPKKVYTLFQINLILFYGISLLLVPVVIVFTYVFHLHMYTSTNYIVLISTIVSLVFFVFGLVYMLIKQDHFKRILKPSYRKEFIILNTFTILGILGFGIFYTYLGGSFFYFPHVVIPLTIISYVVLAFLGYKFFNINLFKN